MSKTNLGLSEVVKGKNAQLWESFPFLLFELNENNIFDYDLIVSILSDEQERSNFIKLLLLSIALYKFLNMEPDWSEELYKKILRENDKLNKDILDSAIKKLVSHLEEDNDFEISEIFLNTKRIKALLKDKWLPIRDYKPINLSPFSIHSSTANRHAPAKPQLQLSTNGNIYSIEYLLSQIFSPKQQELFFKKLSRERLTKTEREYFSRSVKKKLLTLANDHIHQLAKELLMYKRDRKGKK